MHLHLEQIFLKIKRGDCFGVIRPSDGEYLVMENHTFTNCDNWTNHSDGILREQLIEAVKTINPNLYIGIPCNTCGHSPHDIFDNYLNKYPENVNLGLLIKVHGSFNGLLFYKKEIIKIKYNIISNFIKNKFNIYFYCYSKFLGASRIIMGKSWFRIKSILDQNINLKNKIFNAKKIVDPDSLVFSKNDSVIINNHREITIKKIFNSLITRGIKKKNILILRY